MKNKNTIAVILLAFIWSACVSNSKKEVNESLTSDFFDQIVADKDNAQLTLFFSQMPKGGDIHHHYSGAIYAETYLDWASDGYCLKTDSLILKKKGAFNKKCISIEDLKKNVPLYRSVLERWSDLNYSDHFHIQEQPDQHFFNTFSYFGAISGSRMKAGLTEIRDRAKIENVQYIETMLNSPDTRVEYRKTLIDSLAYFESTQDTINLYPVFDKLTESVLLTPGYDMVIDDFIKSLHLYHENIDDSDFMMRFQTCAYRNSSPDAVFTKLYSCFDAVARDKSSLLVGVNILGPENQMVAMKNYWLHMHMFRYLSRRFATVKTAMHAGELAMGMVKPEDLTYHIHDAVFIANASRIGHGIDIPYEKEPFRIINTMKTKKIPVEINLTSNEFIWGVKNNDHPIHLYFNAGVPLVISTDDAGVSRNNLITEYVKLASRYHFTYRQIKSFVFNSIAYSFMREKDKAVVLKNLVTKFQEFESQMATIQSGRS